MQQYLNIYDVFKPTQFTFMSAGKIMIGQCYMDNIDVNQNHIDFTSASCLEPTTTYFTSADWKINLRDVRDVRIMVKNNAV